MPKKNASATAAQSAAPPKPKPIRKRSTDRARRAASLVEDVDVNELDALTLNTEFSASTKHTLPPPPPPPAAASASSTNNVAAAPLSHRNDYEPEDVFSVAAARLDLTESFNFGRSKLQNVIKNANREHRRIALQIKHSVEARVPVLHQCREALQQLDGANIRNTPHTPSAVMNVLNITEQVARSELSMLATLEDALRKQTDEIAALHQHQARSYNEARDVLVRLSEDPTFTYVLRPDNMSVVAAATTATTATTTTSTSSSSSSSFNTNKKQPHRSHSEGAAAVCREIRQHPLVIFGSTEIQRRQFASANK